MKMNPVYMDEKIIGYYSIPKIEAKFPEFERECYELFSQRYGNGSLNRKQHDIAYEQLKWELENIKANERMTSFVIGRLIAKALNRNYCVYGAFASSIVSYLLGISHVEPVANSLCVQTLLGFDGNRFPQLIYAGLDENSISTIKEILLSIEGVSQIIHLSSEERQIIRIIPEYCDVEAYQNMDEYNLELALCGIIFEVGSVKPYENEECFEDYYFRYIADGLNKREAYQKAFRDKKEKGLLYKSDMLERRHFLNGR